MNDYDMVDRHASARDKKRNRKESERMMRGDRSVFTVQQAQRKRDTNTLRKHRWGGA